MSTKKCSSKHLQHKNNKEIINKVKFLEKRIGFVKDKTKVIWKKILRKKQEKKKEIVVN